MLQDRLFSVIRTTINDVVSTQAGIFIYSERIQLTDDIQTSIESRLSVYYVDVLDFGLRSIDFPDAFESAQLEKRVAQEKIETADFERQQSIINAQQLLIEAAAIANVTIIQAEAEANAAFVVREQLTLSNPEYLQWLYLQQLVKLNNPDIVIITGDEVPNFLIPLGEEKELVPV
jgi:regulator of protease activity HflC (stomatin/prohibitin superfamily)